MVDFNTLSKVAFGWPQVILFYIYNNIFPDKEIEKLFAPEKNIVSGFNIHTLNYCYWWSLPYNICPW